MHRIISVCITLSLGVLTSVPGCAGVIVGSGTPETRDFSLEGFTTVEAASQFDVVITESPEYSVSVTADSNLFEHLDIKTSGSTLYLGPKPDASLIQGTLKATVSMPQLDGLVRLGSFVGHRVGIQVDRAPHGRTLRGEFG